MHVLQIYLHMFIYIYIHTYVWLTSENIPRSLDYAKILRTKREIESRLYTEGFAGCERLQSKTHGLTTDTQWIGFGGKIYRKPGS